MNEELEQLSTELGISKNDIIKTYKYYWKFIRETIENMPLGNWGEELSNNRTSFNLPYLGKLYFNKSRAFKIREKLRKNVQHKKN